MRAARGLTAAIVVAACWAASAGATIAPGSRTFNDATGEPQSSGADIKDVVVSNDAAGVLTFHFDLLGVASPPPGFRADLQVDADGNPTDSPPGFHGAEIAMSAEGGSTTLTHWDGTAWVPLVSSTFSYVWANGPTFKVAATDIGATSEVKFYAVDFVQSGAVPAPPSAFDSLPDNGVLTYQLGVVVKPAPKPAPKAKHPKPKPKKKH